MDESRNLYVAECDHTIRKLTPQGILTTLAGVENVSGNTDGSGSMARLNSPAAVAVGIDSTVYVADRLNHTIRKITPAGVVTTLAGQGFTGSSDGVGAAANFNHPAGIARDGEGNVYVADRGNNTIRKISPQRTVTTLAGRAGVLGSADGIGSAATFRHPSSVAVDGNGTLYVADTDNHTIRKITAEGVVTTLAGLAGAAGFFDGLGSAARFLSPGGVAIDNAGVVYVAENNSYKIRKITPDGRVMTLAAVPYPFSAPSAVSLALDQAGNAYVSTFRPDGPILKIAPNGSPSIVASGVGGGLTLDRTGNIYVANTYDQTIVRITPAGTMMTVAGLADGASVNVDGTGNAARFVGLSGIAIDDDGNVYVSDNSSIRVGRPTYAAITDVASTAVASGLTGFPRQLDTLGRTATSWQWSVIRRPAGSIAEVSSTSIRNPIFTPDVPGLFTVLLVASGGGAMRTSTVDLISVDGANQPPGRGRATLH